MNVYMDFALKIHIHPQEISSNPSKLLEMGIISEWMK